MSNSPVSDADEIRQKRLARLQQQDSSASSNSPVVSRTSTPHTPAPPRSSGEVSRQQQEQALPAKSIVPEKRRPASPTTDSKDQFQLWQHRTISSVFAISLQPTSDSTVTYLESLRADFAANGGSGSDILFDASMVDRIILSRLTEYPCDSPFDYLVSCWSRMMAIRRALRQSDTLYSVKSSVLAEIRRLTSSYASLCFTTPDLFGSNVKLSDRLLLNENSSGSVSGEFLQDMCARAVENDCLPELLEPVYTSLSQSLRTKSMIDDYQPFYRALFKLVSIKEACSVLVEAENFLPSNISATTIETDTILGPFFRCSPTQAQVAEYYFPQVDSRQPINEQRTKSALQSEVKTIQHELYLIAERIIRSSQQAREGLLDYFAKICNVNHKRRAMQVDPLTVSSDGFMINVNSVLTRLSEPFMCPNYSKIDKIDREYFLKRSKVDISDETKLVSDDAASKEFYSKRDESINVNFISDAFFLTLASQHYGFGGAMSSYERFSRDIEDMESHKEKLEQERPKWINSPRRRLLEETINRINTQLSKAKSLKAAIEISLHDKLILGRNYAFILTTATWLVREADPDHAYPQKTIELPLRDGPSEIFKNLPEYFIEVVTSLCLFIFRYHPDVLLEQSQNELVTFCITFLQSSKYVKNPYLRAKIAEVLFHGTIAHGPYKHGILGDTLMSLPLAIDELFATLMSFYIEVEQTGASSQFYDKFNIRYQLSMIIKCIWQSPAYRKRLEDSSRDSVDFFVRFVALLLNDVTYLFDESLSKLADIHKYQQEIKQGKDLSDENRQHLTSTERQATSYMSLANETLELLKLFTSAIPKAFTSPEIVDRLAAMLDYNLDALVGPKCTGLKVEDPQKYHFNPKQLLSDLCDVYLNLSIDEKFIQATAKDGRSFKKENFDRAKSILSKYSVKSSMDINKLNEFATRVENCRIEIQQGEEELGDIPDEFLDPLMYTLMTDPVILPSSKVSIDRSTLKAHLLSDATDPFNRNPLKMDDVVPNDKLRHRIQEFLTSRGGHT